MTSDKSSILLIEDDPNDVLLVQRAFQKCGLQRPMLVMPDGEEAIAYLSGAGQYANRERCPFPSFIITDLKMPRAGGFEVLKWLKDRLGAQLIPVVVFTSSRDHNDVTRAYELGAHSYIVKPSSFEELQETIRRWDAYWQMCEKPKVQNGPTAQN